MIDQMSKQEFPQSEEQQGVVERLAPMADKYFGQIAEGLSNRDLFLKEVAMPGLTKFVVSRLEHVENEDLLFWQDDELRKWFEDKVSEKKLDLPDDPVDRERWIALLSVAASKIEGFAYGNVIFVPDFLPETSEEFESYRNKYDEGVIEDILAHRRNLRSSRM